MASSGSISMQRKFSTSVRRLGSVKRPTNVKIVLVGDPAVGKTHMIMMYTTGSPPDNYNPTLFENYSKRMSIGEKPINLGIYDTAGQEDYDTLRPLSYPDTDVFILCFSITRKTSIINITSKWLKEIKKYHPNTPIILCGTKIDYRDDEEFVEDMEYRGKYSQITPDPGKRGRSALQQLEESIEGMVYSKSKAVYCILQFWFGHNPLITDYKLTQCIEQMIDIDIGFHPRFIAVNRSFGECFAAEIGALEYVECSGVTGEGIEFAFERATVFGLQRAEQRRQEKGCCACESCAIL